MPRFTFKVVRAASGTYWCTVRCNGEELFQRAGESRGDALALARLDAEAYGWIDC